MKVGICSALENIEKVEAMGFDYIEPGVASIAKMSDSDFKKALSDVKKRSIKCEVFNFLFPPEIKIVGKDADVRVIKEYLAGSFERVAMLGGSVVVFGSGGARYCPDYLKLSEAWKEISEVSFLIGEEAARNNLVIALEPLNSTETNTVNSVAEGLKLVEEVNHPNFKLLADFYHMRLENEQFEIIERAGATLKHLHIANSNGRVYPLKKDEDKYEKFFRVLKKIKYDGRISIEATTQAFDIDAPMALSLLRSIIDEQ